MVSWCFQSLLLFEGVREVEHEDGDVIHKLSLFLSRRQLSQEISRDALLARDCVQSFVQQLLNDESSFVDALDWLVLLVKLGLFGEHSSLLSADFVP